MFYLIDKHIHTCQVVAVSGCGLVTNIHIRREYKKQHLLYVLEHYEIYLNHQNAYM